MSFQISELFSFYYFAFSISSFHMNFLNKKLILQLVIALSVMTVLTVVSADSSIKTRADVLTIQNPAGAASFIAASAGLKSTEYTSKVINTDFPFNSVAFSWKEDKPIDFELYVRFQKESWGAWQPVSQMVDFKDGARKDNVSDLVFSPFTNILQYKTIFKTVEDRQNLKELSISYIDSTRGHDATYKTSTVDSTDSLKIIPRKEWGADESLRYDTAGNETWPREYYTPTRFIIHHTDNNNVTDSAATVRAIYYYHTIGHDWGDIGYNYLIDGKGNIYEGRSGGDGVVGAHAEGYNRNTIGIAIIGCYHPTASTCANPDQLSPETAAALEKLIAVKSQLFGINPEGVSNFLDKKDEPQIIGHRDVGYTNCPGDNLYPRLTDIRTESNVKLASLSPLITGEALATLQIPPPASLEIPDGSTGRVVVSYKNTGQATWHGYADNYLLITTDYKKLTSINGLKFASSSQPSVVSGFKLVEGNVKPGKTGTFIMDLPAQNGTLTYSLAWQGKGYFPGTEFTIATVKTAALNTSIPVKPVLTYLGLINNSTIPATMPANTTATGELSIYNIGTATWSTSDLKLELTLEDGTPSPLNPIITLKNTEATIEPNGIATYNLSFTAPIIPSATRNIIKFSAGANQIIQFNQSIDIISPFAAQITEDTVSVSMRTKDHPKVKLTLKNIGSENWINPMLKSTDKDGTISWFQDPTWQNSKTVKTIKKTIKPGESVTFEFKLRPYWKPKDYPSIYKLWAGKTGNQAITINGVEILEKSTKVTK